MSEKETEKQENKDVNQNIETIDLPKKPLKNDTNSLQEANTNSNPNLQDGDQSKNLQNIPADKQSQENKSSQNAVADTYKQKIDAIKKDLLKKKEAEKNNDIKKSIEKAKKYSKTRKYHKNFGSILKFIGLSVITVFFILCENIYFQVENYADNLAKELNIVIFLNKNSNDDESTRKKIIDTGLIEEKEYVDSQTAYEKAVNHSAILKDLSSDGVSYQIPAYLVANPSFEITEISSLSMKSTLENFDGIDEVVYDTYLFKKYEKITFMLNFYKKTLEFSFLVIFVLFALKCLFFLLKGKRLIKKLLVSTFKCFLSSSFGFFMTWFFFIYMFYPMFMDDISALAAILACACLGTLLEQS
ncbi:MAG: hypothetical protein LBU55_06220 [Elusimicrobiota bacterium]|jgi:cell division protein FtsX|nr:hypothetical protein [Elusimicrobiota bacterium]